MHTLVYAQMHTLIRARTRTHHMHVAHNTALRTRPYEPRTCTAAAATAPPPVTSRPLACVWLHACLRSTHREGLPSGCVVWLEACALRAGLEGPLLTHPASPTPKALRTVMRVYGPGLGGARLGLRPLHPSPPPPPPPPLLLLLELVLVL